MILDCLPAFRVIYEKETLIINNLFSFHISAAIHSRFHSHLLSKLVPKLKLRKSSIIVLFDTQIS